MLTKVYKNQLILRSCDTMPDNFDNQQNQIIPMDILPQQMQGQYMQPPQKQLQGVIAQLINSDTLLKNLERNLGGWKWNEQFKKWAQDERAVLMNSNGISIVLGMLGPLISPNTILTIVSEGEIKRKVYLDVSKPMTLTLGSNLDEFAIRPSYLPMIISMIEVTYEHALRRGMDGRTLKFVFSNISESTQRNMQDNPSQHRGWLPNLSLPFLK